MAFEGSIPSFDFSLDMAIHELLFFIKKYNFYSML
jgi:hypothetical protein